MGKIARYLNELIVGNVFDSSDVLEDYATDRSILKIKPKAVALPESTDDVSRLMRFCNQLAMKDIKTPVVVRGAGLDEMGADLSEGIVISTEKLDHLLEADRRERLVRVQAGITLKELNTALSMHGLTIPIHGHESDTIGGLISNCPADAYAGKYGGIMKYVERIEVVLANGDVLQTNRMSENTIAKIAQSKNTEGKIYRKVSDLIKSNDELIQKIAKDSHGLAGYFMVTKAEQKGSLDLMPLFFGAQGTLGIVTEAILKAVPIRNKIARVMATFRDFNAAQNFLDFAITLNPKQLDFYDMSVIKAAKNTGKKISIVTDRSEKGFVVFAKFDRRVNANLRKVNNFKHEMLRTAQLTVESVDNKVQFDELENSLISFLNQVRSGERVPLVVDFYLPSENIVRFLDDLSVVEKSLKMDLELFGSYAASNYSLRPKFNPEDEDFAKKVLAFLRASAFVIKRQNGSITGGAPEGRVKAIVTNNELSEEEKNLYLEIKKMFDPREILGSEIKLGADAKFTVNHFRTTDPAKTVL